jgi:hypothetical protein
MRQKPMFCEDMTEALLARMERMSAQHPVGVRRV